MSNNPFDFTDLSDLPEELQKKLHTETTDNARVYADVVQKGIAAGFSELDINQIMAAAIRMGIEVPTQQTVRNYLNKAVELGLINKPGRQTYGAAATTTKAESTGLTGSADAVVTAEVATPAEDPLAALGI